MIVQLWNTNTSAFVSCDADLTENYMYISMKFGTGVHVFCWEVGVFNRSSFQSVSYKVRGQGYFDIKEKTTENNPSSSKEHTSWYYFYANIRQLKYAIDGVSMVLVPQDQIYFPRRSPLFYYTITNSMLRDLEVNSLITETIQY